MYSPLSQTLLHNRVLTSNRPSEVKSLSRVQLFATHGLEPTRSHSLQPTDRSRQEYWSGLPFPSPGDLPDPETEPRSPTLQADALPSEPPGKPLTGQTVLKAF